MPITRLKKSSIRNFEFFRKISAGFSLFGLGSNEFKRVGDYFYHIFSSSGTFRLTRAGNFEVATIGAGGEAGSNMGGGGGGAEIDTFFTINGTVGEYTINVGSTNANDRGGDTIVSRGPTTHVTTLGGGNGGYHNAQGPWTGGSGGGGSDSEPGSGGTGANTTSGGAGTWSNNPSCWVGGGGGGATSGGGSGSQSGCGNMSNGAGGQGMLLTSIDTNLTSANFTSFSGMTRVSSGGAGRNQGSGGTYNQPGTGAGQALGDTLNPNPTPSSSYGSGGGGGPGPTDLNRRGFNGVVIIRHSPNN